jgi:putative transcriptional regulator
MTMAMDPAATIRHHLSDSLLMGYAAGSLPEAFNLVVATHVSMCDECRARLVEFEALGGEVLDDQPPVDLAQASLAATLNLIDNADWAPKPVVRRQKTGGIFPAPLQDYVGGDLDAVRWARVGGGVAQAILPTHRDATVRLLRIPGGARMPDHGHRGMEMTLVLQGAFRDETDRFGRGDVEVADEAMVHQPVAEPGPDCICLAATDAPLRFRSLVPRMVQSYFRI